MPDQQPRVYHWMLTLQWTKAVGVTGSATREGTYTTQPDDTAQTVYYKIHRWVSAQNPEIPQDAIVLYWSLTPNQL